MRSANTAKTAMNVVRPGGAPLAAPTERAPSGALLRRAADLDG